MATIITEVYVSLDGLEFTKLDLHKDERIPMRYTTKDLQDISKIFSPYSLSFTFPASSRNRAAFGFFGDTDVIKINTDSKFITKIYTNTALNLSGFIQLSDLQYRNSKPSDFVGSFSTSMTNLADRLGDDLIGDLTDEEVLVDWSPKNVYNLLQGAQSVDVEGINLSYFVPLISSTRVLAYQANIESALKDNVAYDFSIDPDSENTIKANELRPCMTFSTIIELIKKKYELDVTSPLELRKEYTEARIWCNSEKMFAPKDTQLTIKDPFGSIIIIDKNDEGDIPDPKKYVPTADIAGDFFRVERRTPLTSDDNKYYDKFFTLKVFLQNVLITDQSDSPTINLKVLRQGTGDVLLSKQFDMSQDPTYNNVFDCDLQIADELFTAGSPDYIEFYIVAQLNQPTTWSNCFYKMFFSYLNPKTGLFISSNRATYVYNSRVNNNSADAGGTVIDLFKSLPEMKVVDFLTSYFKTFNISVFDTSPNDEKLYWLTPEDIQTSGLVYSKATLDYTPYLNSEEFKKAITSEINFYNFKHATSEYRSNLDYLSAEGLEYGQAVYPAIKPDNPVEFIVDTEFTLMVPVKLFGSDDIITYYGFDGSAPEILETGESRYAPNYGELTIFYNAGNTPITNVLGFQSTNASGFTINAHLNSYMKVLPFNSDNNSLAFSVLKFLEIEYPESLYKRYYQAQTERLLDPNVLSQEFELDLPPDEIYLNEATTIQGGGQTPKGFRLQNDIILREDLFTILDTTIDVTTGKTKITLLNF